MIARRIGTSSFPALARRAGLVVLLLAGAFAIHGTAAKGDNVTLRGVFHVLHEHPRSVPPLFFLATSDRVVDLDFGTVLPAIKPESVIEVTGTAHGAALTPTNVRVVSAPARNATAGTRRLLVVDVVWGNRTLQTTKSTATNFVFGTTDPQRRSLKQYYQDASYGQLNWVGDVTPTLSIADPGTCSTSTLYTIASEADKAAKAAGYDPANYDNEMYNIPGPCSWSGVAEVGGSHSWVKDALWDLDDGYSRMEPDHELGHNLGLWHAHGLNCGAKVITESCLSGASGRQCDLQSFPPPCYSEYGNSFDLMGNNTTSNRYDAVNWFGFPEQLDLGWFGGRYKVISDPGTAQVADYDVTPIEQQGAVASQGLEITTAKHVYFLEARSATGQDSYLTNYPDATSGVLISMRNDIPGGNSGPLTLDTSPQSNTKCTYCDFYDAALNLGQVYDDVDGRFLLTVTRVTPGVKITVEIAWQAQTPIPTITAFSPTTGSPGAIVTITGTNFDGAQRVKLGAADAKFTAVSSTKITATVPSVGSGAYKWKVVTPGGKAVSDSSFKVS